MRFGDNNSLNFNTGVYILHENHIFSKPQFSKCIFFPYFQDMKGTKSFTKLCKNYKSSLFFIKTVLQID